MHDPKGAQPDPPSPQEAEVIEIVESASSTQPLSVVEPQDELSRSLELQRLRHRQEVELMHLRQEDEEKKHKRKRELIDRVAGHVLRFTIVVGGVVLFPLHYPVVGGLLLGAGLDLLTKSELRGILKGAISGYRGGTKK